MEDWNWETIYAHNRSIFNHCDIIGLQSYRIRRKKRIIRAITPFKVIQGHLRNGYDGDSETVNVLARYTALKRWIATEIRWYKNVVFRGSAVKSVALLSLLPVVNLFVQETKSPYRHRLLKIKSNTDHSNCYGSHWLLRWIRWNTQMKWKWNENDTMTQLKYHMHVTEQRVSEFQNCKN